MIYIAGDHLTIELMQQLEGYLTSKGLEYKNLGAKSAEEITQLQKIIPAVTQYVRIDDTSSGVLACGTGTGVEIGANRFRGIRASLCRDAEQAKNARIYDNANVLCLGSWYQNDVAAIMDAWLSNKFGGDESLSQMLRDFDEWR